MQDEPWVAALRDAARRMGGNGPVGRLLGFSRPAISRVLNHSYGDTSRVRAAVERHLLNPVECPGLGLIIDPETCHCWRSRPFDASNHVSVAMYRACRSCPKGDAP